MSISLSQRHTKNIIHGDSSIDIEKNNDDSIIRIENPSLLEIFQSDRYLTILFMIIGYYTYDERHHIIVRLLAISWQVILIILGTIGFLYQLILGIVSIRVSPAHLLSSIGNILYVCIIPILQVGSLLYSLHMFKQQMKQPCKVNTITKLLPLIKRDACIFFISMALLVIIINPININRTSYDAYYHLQLVERTYSLFAFQQATLLFFNLAITCYLTVILIFISLVLSQVTSLQEDIINAVDANTLTCNEYSMKKNEISFLQMTHQCK
jgi:hypothetical protein